MTGQWPISLFFLPFGDFKSFFFSFLEHALCVLLHVYFLRIKLISLAPVWIKIHFVQTESRKIPFHQNLIRCFYPTRTLIGYWIKISWWRAPSCLHRYENLIFASQYGNSFKMDYFWAERDDFIPYEATNFLIECILQSRGALDWPSLTAKSF